MNRMPACTKSFHPIVQGNWPVVSRYLSNVQIQHNMCMAHLESDLVGCVHMLHRQRATMKGPHTDSMYVQEPTGSWELT